MGPSRSIFHPVLDTVFKNTETTCDLNLVGPYKKPDSVGVEMETRQQPISEDEKIFEYD